MTDYSLLFAIPGGAELLVFGLIALAIFIFWLLTILEIVNSEFTDPNSKIVWLLISILLGVLGAVIYRFAGRQNRVPKN